MFHEYALEPSVLSSWDRVRFFLDAFGPWKGRFLAQFPRHWKRMVHEALQCPDLEKKRIVERLACLDRRVFSPRSNVPYDSEKHWFDNALAEHARSPFRAIIAHERSGSNVLDAATLDDRSDLWRVDSGGIVPRDAAVFVKAIELLLLASSKIIVVDPFFRADQLAKTRPLVAFCDIVATSSVAIEVHFRDEPRSYALCMADAERFLPRLLPFGSKVTLRCWKEKVGGARLHNRYLLTDIGGVQFGDGIEVGDPGHEDRVSILDEPSRARLWAQFVGSSPAFEVAGEAREFAGAVRAERR
jgi:hypothetical protein